MEHFTGLTLDTPLQTSFTTGKAIRLSGILTDTSLSGILFRLTPASGGDPIEWFFDVIDGRFDGNLLLNHGQAGEYNLALFARNKEPESWVWLGSFSPMKILQGQGEILLPVDFFTGVLLDEPLSTEFGTSTASSFAGEVLDPALANGHILFNFLHLDSGEEIPLFIDLEGQRFRRGLLFDQDRPGAGDYELSVFIGQQGWLNVSFVGRFAVELVDDGAIDLSDCSYPLPSCKEVDVSEPSQVGLNPKNLAELSEWFLEKKDLPIFSLLIARENKLVYEIYSGDVKPEMSHYLFSTTKSVTSALVGAAIAEGKISGVDVPISQIIPSKLFSSPEQQKRWDAVTLKNAMGMSVHSVATPPHDNSPEGWARQERLASSHSRLKFVLGEDVMENPGEKFLYNDLTPYLVSGALAYNVGTDLLTYGGQTIFGKLGFRNAAWLHQDPSGLDIGGYGLKLRPVDMLKFGLTYLNEGVYKGKRILPKEWVDLAYKPYMPPDVETPYYGYYWWKGWYQHNGVVYETIEANGWRGQHIVIMPKLKLVLVATHYLNDEDDKKDLKRLYLEKYILPAILEKPRLTAEDKEWSSKILTYNSQIQKGPSRFPENGEERVRPGLSNKNKRIRFNQTATAVVETRTTPVPQAFVLMQNYPNPFNSSTVIHFSLPTSDIVDLSIYNIAGQQVATLAQGMRQAGTHVINWTGKDDNEHALASGLYFYRLQSRTHQQTRKLLLLR